MLAKLLDVPLHLLVLVVELLMLAETRVELIELVGLHIVAVVDSGSESE